MDDSIDEARHTSYLAPGTGCSKLATPFRNFVSLVCVITAS